MSFYSFFLRQYKEVTTGGAAIFGKKCLRGIAGIFSLPPALLFFLLMRLSRPWIVIRLVRLNSSRIGHFATNTELYLCERDAGINVPENRYLDFCYHAEHPIANRQLAKMWGRRMIVWPAWLLNSVFRLNRRFPGGAIHEGGITSNSDRDLHDLLERMPPHLAFTRDEELRGEAELRAMGVPEGSKFVCLAARDSAYLKNLLDLAPNNSFDYHNYRDVDIQSFVKAVKALADGGYYVIRMGATVNAPLDLQHPRVIDYASNGMRSDFMDIYLGAKCFFCISCGTGFDAIPAIFRRPIANVSFVPVAYFGSYLNGALGIFKKHWDNSKRRYLTLQEIFDRGLALANSSGEFESQGISLIENSPEEIESLVSEMIDRLTWTWNSTPEDEALQRRFWEIFPLDVRDPYHHRPLHGKVRARHGTQFLRDNPWFLQ